MNNVGKNDTIPINEDITTLNVLMGQAFTFSLKLHVIRIKNGTLNELVSSAERSHDDDVVFNLNCDPETADKEFLAEVQKSDNRTQEAFESCKPISDDINKSWLQHVADLEFRDIMASYFIVFGITADSMLSQREDFDLKASALGKWAK